MRFDKLTTKFQQALADAQSLAIQNDNQYIDPLHVLAALLADTDSGSGSLLARAGVAVNRLGPAVNNAIKNLAQVPGSAGNVQIGRELQSVLARTDKEASSRGDTYIASELFLLTLADDKGEAGRLLREAGLQRKPLEAAIEAVRGGANVSDAEGESNREALNKYTTDLTERAREGKLDPVIGRDDEIRRTIQILQRRTKNNPVLIGEPGVGKTAIVEGLAQRIVNNEVPETLKGKRVLSLDLAALLAGAKYRGEFEERLKSVLKELSQDQGGILCSLTSCTPWWVPAKPKAPWTPATCSSLPCRVANCIALALRHSTNTANTSRKTPRSSVASRKCLSTNLMSSRPLPSCAACKSATSCTMAWPLPTRLLLQPPSFRTVTSPTASCPTRPST
jgi:hypothetical protein